MGANHHQGKLVVANRASDTISVIDSNTSRRLSNIKIKPLENNFNKTNYYAKEYVAGPHNLAYSYKTGRVYCTNCFDNSMSVIDIQKMYIISTFFVGAGPNDLVVDDINSTIYVTNCDSNTISVVDINNNKLIGQIPVGLMPQGICINKQAGIIAVANTNSNSISIIYTNLKCDILNIKLDFSPIKVIFSTETDKLYISAIKDNNSGVILVMDLCNFDIVAQIKIEHQNPIHMVEVNDKQMLFVCCTGDGYLCVIDTSKIQIIDCLKIGSMVHAMVCDNEYKYMYITDMKNDNIIRFDLNKFIIQDRIYCDKEPNGIIYI